MQNKYWTGEDCKSKLSDMKLPVMLLCTVLLTVSCSHADVRRDDMIRSYTITDLSFSRDELTLRGRLYTPDKSGPYPLVIISHGFGETAAETARFAVRFAEKGIAAYVFDFAGGSVRGRSDGTTTTMSVLTELDDLNSVIDGFKDYPDIDSSRIFLFGDSQGGFVSAMAAADRGEDISGLILFYPALVIPDDTRKEFSSREAIRDVNYRFGTPIGRVYHEAVYDMDALEEIKGYNGPVLIIHGDADSIVPYSYSVQADRDYGNSRLIILPGAGHGFYGSDFDSACNEAVSFVGGLL